jgi:hypothetical protein
MRFQASMGKEVTRRYKDGKNMVRLSLARVTKVNYKYNTVEVVTIQGKNSTANNPNDNGRYSARLPVQFGGQTPDGKVYGTNTLVTSGALVLIGFLEGNKDNPIVLNIYSATDNQSMLTRTTFTNADESDEELQQELWQLFTLYPSMTYKNIDGHGNQEVTFPGKSFFYTSADDQKVNDAYFDYDHLPSAYYANGDLIEPTVPDAPNMLFVHQGVYDKHRVTFFIKSDGTVRMGSRHADGQGVTFYQLGTDGSFRIQQSNDTVDPEDESNNFSAMSIEEDGTVLLQAGEHKLAIGPNGITLDGGTLSGGNIDLSSNQTIKDIQGDIYTLQEATTATGIVSVVTESSGWQDLTSSIGKKTQTYLTQPIPPYNMGDVWENNGTIYVCVSPEPIGATFDLNDWKLAGDVTANSTAKDVSNIGGTPTNQVLASISSAASTAADKAQSFNAQPVPPYSLGDLWTLNNAFYSCIHARLSGEAFNATDWVIVADKTSANTASDTAKVNGVSASTVTTNITNAQSTADSKAQTFISQPNPPYNKGDIWVNSGQTYVSNITRPSTASFILADWVLQGDVTANNTAADTSKVAGTSASTVLTNITTAQSTADSKSKTFTTQPAPPYKVGDIWKNGQAVYICTTARTTGSYTAGDWLLAGDVTSNNTAADTASVGGVTATQVNQNITNAQTTANSKARGFITQPTTPYSLGDIWNNSGTVYICTTARASGAFVQADWTLAGDVTANNTAYDTNHVGGTSSTTVLSNITTAQNTADSKAFTFMSQPTPPYALGDLWNNSGTMYTCMNAKANNGTFDIGDWELTADVTANNTAADTAKVGGTSSSTVLSNITTAQSTADSKSATYTAQPAPPYKVGDLWKSGQSVYICTTAKASGGTFSTGDWILVGDVTANNTAADTASVGGVTATQVNQNITNAQTTANSKAKGFITQPTTPYSLGDVWNNTGTVYICTTARASGAFVQADWSLAGDITANNTSADTSKVNGVSAVTVQSQAQAGAMLTQDPGFTQGLFYLSADDATASAGTTLSGADFSVVAGAGVQGGNVIQIKNSHWNYSKYAYPVDTSHTYKVRFRVRQTADPTTVGLANVYCGVATYDNTGALQTTSPGTHRWCVVAGQTITVAQGWQYFEGTITGTGNTTANQFRPGTVAVKLAFIVNYNNGNGTAQVDMLELIDITQQMNAQTYTDTSVSNLVIGGRNYLKNTSNMNDLTNWTFNLGSNITGTLNIVNDPVYNGVLDFNITSNNNVSNNWIVIENTGLTLPNGKFTIGNYYTLSFLMKNDLTMYVEFADDTGLNPVAARSSTIPVSTTWREVIYTFKATATGNTPVFYLSTNDQTDIGHVYVTNLQLEDGNKATGYNPAPEDVQNQIDAVNEQMYTITTGQFMGNANYGGLTQGIINTVTSSDTYTLDMSTKAAKSDLTGLATSTEVQNAQGSAQDYADKKVAGIDFSPYVKNQTYIDDAAETQRTYTSSGGVNMLQNSVGYSGTDFWTVTLNANGSVSTSQDPSLDQYGSFNGFAINGGMIQQTVTVTPNVPYTLGVILNKGLSGDAYIKLDDGQGTHQILDFPNGTAYPWPTATIKQKNDGTSYAYVSPFSINITPTSSSLTVTLYADAAVPATVFTCVMLNVGSQPFTWQQHMGEVYNANITFDENGIRVSHTDANGKLTNYTVMTPEKFAGYSDINGDGAIDDSTGSIDEIFRMDGDTFRMKSATIGAVKIVQVNSGGYNGIAFIKSS